MNHVQDQFEAICGAMFFYDENLVFSGVTHDEARIIKRYMPSYLDDRFKQLKKKIPEEGFLTGPVETANQHVMFSAPRVYLQNSQDTNIIVFKVSFPLLLTVKITNNIQ